MVLFMHRYTEKVEDLVWSNEIPSGIVTDIGKGPSVSESEIECPIDTVQLAELLDRHQYDPNFDVDYLTAARQLLDNARTTDGQTQGELSSEIEAQNELLLNDSPYAEVRAVVSPTDDPTTPVNTFRVWFLGTIFAVLGLSVNQLVYARKYGLGITSFTAQLLIFPCGLTMARYLPARRFGRGRWSFTLNPGPFNQKEHGLITVMSNASIGGGYVSSLLVLLKVDVFFGDKFLANSATFQILVSLSTQLLGYGCAGIARRFLVYPPTTIWPDSLVQIALIKALHNDDGSLRVPRWSISRQRFGIYCFVGMFIYHWFPGYLFQALSYFNWITWIAPKNVTLAVVTGSFCGLGLNPWPTFDWAMVTSITDPIITPFFSTVNITAGSIILTAFVAPLMIWNNAFNTAYLSVNSWEVFDKFGDLYNMSRILNSDRSFNVEAYHAYGAPYFGASYIVSATAQWAQTTATISHVLLYHWAELKSGAMTAIKWEDARKSHNDIHNRLMKNYPDVPEWWFVMILLFCFIMGCILCTSFSIGLPLWSFCLAGVLCVVLQVPIGIVTAVTNVQIFNNMISELIAGYMVVGNAITNVVFKCLVTSGCMQSILFSQDLKLGHYLKIPPRTIFAAQVYACILSSVAMVGLNAWQSANIKGYCHPTQSAGFTCPGEHLFYDAAILWGVIGPQRIIGPDGIYSPLKWAFLVGALLPVPFWLLMRKYPYSSARYIHVPATLYSAFSNFSSVWPACVFAFIFNYHVKRRYLAWWQKYAYVLTTSATLGTCISGIFIFLAIFLGNKSINWWGNNVSFNGVDGGNENAPLCLLRILPTGEQMPGS